MKLKDFIKVLDANYEIGVIDDGEKVFQCKTDSSVLKHYEEREVQEISLKPSMLGSSYIVISLKKGDADNE